MIPKHMYAQVSYSNHIDAQVSQVTNLEPKLHMTVNGILYRIIFITKVETTSSTKQQQSKYL